MRKYRAVLFCIALFMSVFPAACSKGDISKTEFVLGTVCTVTLQGGRGEKAFADVFRRLREIENRMSVNIAGSEVDRINAAAGKEPVPVSGDVFEVIEKAVYFAGISGGAFDPAIGPLVSLWGIGGENPRLPSREEIEAALPLVSWRGVKLYPETKSVFLESPGMKLDLGAIAKGYAADEAASILRQARVKKAIIDLGGNILTVGEKEDKTPWKIGVQNPLDGRGAYTGIAAVKEKTVVTSGVYERRFELDGTSYHHILSSLDGYPVQNGLLSVTIIADKSIEADALSTAVFAMGYKDGRALAESLPGVEAVFIFDDMSVRKTAGADFTLTDESYRLLPD